MKFKNQYKMKFSAVLKDKQWIFYLYGDRFMRIPGMFKYIEWGFI